MRCYIFDLDGTLCDHSHRLPLIAPDREGGKDWNAFHAAIDQDPPHRAIVELARDLQASGALLLFVTGRMDTEDARRKTVVWLADNLQYGTAGYYSSRLWMRKEDDFREDTIIKEELLAEIRAKGFQPFVAFEDRPRICDMWERNGIAAARVGHWQEALAAPTAEVFSQKAIDSLAAFTAAAKAFKESL